MTDPRMEELLRAQLAAHGIDALAFLDAEHLHILQEHLMPEGIRGAAVWLIPYYTGPHPNRNLSLYSVSKDYHVFARALGTVLTETLGKAFPDERFYCFCDSSPLDEVRAAAEAGLGVLGQNRLLISPVYGSYVFIGSLLTTARFASAAKTEPGSCLGCGKCRAACDFLDGRSTVCASELNQRKELTASELAAVRSRKIRWGCDVCQEVCPMNKNVLLTPIPFFYEDCIEVLTPEMLLSMTKNELKQRAFGWRGRKTILRNVTEN
ncbi:MAG: epoxyqueuosine reductase [Eubacteriales bacterium]